MKETLDISAIRRTNKMLVLNAIYEKDETSRSQLAKELRLSKPAVSDNLMPLLNLRIIEEIGEGQPSQYGGRKPLMIRFNSEYKYIIAIDLNFNTPIFVLSDLKNNIKRKFEINVDKDVGEEAQMLIIEDGIRLLINAGGVVADQIYCIAIACPGVYDENGELVSDNPRFSGINWSNFRFKYHLKKVFGINTFVMNDINAAALGEWALDNKKIENCLFLSCGYGLGAGMILDGKLYVGCKHNAGEIYNYLDIQRLHKGVTIEQEICIEALIKRCVVAVESGEETILATLARENIDFEAIKSAYQENDQLVCRIIEEICDELSVITCNYVNLIPVQKVVLGGDYLAFGETYKKRLVDMMVKYCNITPNIESAKNYSGIYGLLIKTKNILFNQVCNNG